MKILALLQIAGSTVSAVVSKAAALPATSHSPHTIQDLSTPPRYKPSPFKMYDTYDEVYKLGIREFRMQYSLHGAENTGSTCYLNYAYLEEHGIENVTDISQLPGLNAGSGNNTAQADQGYIINVPMRDGYLNPLRVHKPKTPPASGKSPLVVFVFGGGFTSGDNRQMSPFSRILNHLHGATVVNLSYRLVPAYRWPTAPNDVWDNLKWIAENSETLGADLSAGFVLGGASAGGNLAAVTAQKWIGQGLEPKLTGVQISIPVLFVEENVPTGYKDLWFSRDQNRDAFILNTADVDGMIQAYAPDTSSLDWSPVNAENHSFGFPRTYLSVSGGDPLRDDGLVYWRILRDRGIETRLDVAPGVPHAHAMFEGLKSAEKTNVESIQAFGWLLRDEKTIPEIVEALGGGNSTQF